MSESECADIIVTLEGGRMGLYKNALSAKLTHNPHLRPPQSGPLPTLRTHVQAHRQECTQMQAHTHATETTSIYRQQAWQQGAGGAVPRGLSKGWVCQGS